MKFLLRYIVYHKKFIILYTVFLGIFCISFYLYQIPARAAAYPAGICAVILSVAAGIDFMKVYERHKVLERLCSIPDNIMRELPEHTDYYDDYREIIESMCSENRRLNTELTGRYEELIDYFTVWVHQIKVPISSMYLVLDNEDSAESRKLAAGLKRIEQYVEMVLAYLRLESESTDYVIKEYDIDNIIKHAVRKMSGEFIYRKLYLEYKETGKKVITDEKWLGFVIEQVLSNALKYTKEGGIRIYVNDTEQLCIEDTGIGIAQEDLQRIFEKGYTGYNGRRDRKASGIGLYLCKRICNNLGHSIDVKSEGDKGTTVCIGIARETYSFE